MTSPTRVRLALALFCVFVLVRPSWAQHHGSGGHGGGSFGFHAGGGPSFGGQPAFRPPAPSPAPRPLNGPVSSYRGTFAPFSFRGPGHFVRPGAGFQHFRSSDTATRGAATQGRVPRSAYLAGRNPRYWSQPNSRAGNGRPLSGTHGTRLTAANRSPMTGFHGHPHVFPPQSGFFNPFFGNVFFHPRPFFFWPFFYPTFTWWWYPPLTFSDSNPSQGCPYEDYNYQRQPSYQPEEQAGEAEQPAESAEEAANVPPAQPEVQTAPFTYETPLPDVIEWGKASEAVPEKKPASAGQGPLVVNLPHHTLTILLNEPSSLSSHAP
jgi:hypothetical protein